jgi:Outer membrane protein beta-barrel domain
MKKLLLFCIGFFAVSYANIGYAQMMMIGARAGVNLANEAYSYPYYGESISIKLGLLVGGQFDYWFNRSWAMSFQLIYDQKGAHADGNDNYGSYSDWTDRYLEIPILAKLSFGDGSVRPYIFAGPSFGVLISSIEKMHYLGGSGFVLGIATPHEIDTTADITDSTSKIDFSIVAGAGVSVTLTSGLQLFFDAAYAFGLANIDGYDWDKQYGISVYSRDIRIAAGVLFPLN